MGKGKQDKGQPESNDAFERYRSSDVDQAKARKWFARAKELTNAKNWDYAIQCYLDGLGFWPEAVEEGHQLLRLAASERGARGGKKPGFADTMKYSMTGKDAKKAMLNAAWLLARDPRNASYMEGLLKNANKLHCEDTLAWIGPIYSNAIESEKKLNPKRFALLREVNEEAGDRVSTHGESTLAVEFYERAAAALQLQRQADPKDLSLENELRDLSTKLTILRGKYDSASSFQESMADADGQKDLHDQDRLVQDVENIRRLMARAERELAEAPDNPGKVETLVELLCRQEDQENETRAIKLLLEKHQTYGDFRFRVRAEDIKVKQMRRSYRAARDGGDAERAKTLKLERLRFEIGIYRDRVKQYPTDNRLKYELATRLFQAVKFDEAIPQFQASRVDPKVRIQADLYLGRCFFEKKFHAQAIGTLRKAADSYGIPDDRLAKDLNYWLARALEAEGRTEQAREVYGGILELDYNFRDVRDRLQGLSSAGDA